MARGTRAVEEEAVKVIEVKTVGAYEVAVLSAQDAGSLERWLKAHDYSIPEGKAGIIDEYIRKGLVLHRRQDQPEQTSRPPESAAAAPKGTECSGPGAQARFKSSFPAANCTRC